MQGIRTGYGGAFYHLSVHLKTLYSHFFLKSDCFSPDNNFIDKTRFVWHRHRLRAMATYIGYHFTPRASAASVFI